MNTGHCPETSKDANGYNRYYRLKVLLNVAEETLYVMQCQSSTSREGQMDVILCCTERPSVKRAFLYFHVRGWLDGLRP